MSVLHFDEGSGNPVFWCPGCEEVHVMYTETGAILWTFNGHLEKPTFTPSLLNTRPGTPYRCHVVVTNGVLDYCGDCSHALAGKSIPMVEWRGFDPDKYAEEKS